MTRIDWTPETACASPWEDEAKIEGLARKALDPLKELHDAMEDELADAVGAGDPARAARIAWSYGLLAAAISEIETS